MARLVEDEVYEVPAMKRPELACRRVLQVISHLDPRLGGISAVVPRLANEMSRRHQVDSELCLFDGKGKQVNSLDEGGSQSSIWPASRMRWMRDRLLRERFRDLLRTADAVHIHGLWETSVTVASRLARVTGTPYVISAHGMLEPWALRNKALKKQIYSALVERSNLQHATCLHALTGAEAEDYRRFGCKQPIAIVANGVDSPGLAERDLFIGKFPALTGKTLLLFLGRIHFKKGLDVLISAWAAIARQFPSAVLVLAGPDSENSESTARHLIEQFGIANQTLFTGMLDAEMKWSALAAATCFVLPSYSEGLSVAVLEALSMGVPVIVSEQCHFPEIATAQAGWVVKTEMQTVQQAMREVLENSDLANAVIGEHGKLLAKTYGWETVSARMAELYGWLASGSGREQATCKGLWA